MTDTVNESLAIGNIYGRRNPSRDKSRRLLEIGATDKTGYIAPVFGLLAGIADAQADDYDKAMAEQMKTFYQAKAESMASEEARKTQKDEREAEMHSADMYVKHAANAAKITETAKQVYAAELTRTNDVEKASEATTQTVNQLMTAAKLPFPPLGGVAIGPDNMMTAKIVLGANKDGSFTTMPVKMDAQGNMWTPAGAPDESGRVQWSQLDPGKFMLPADAKQINEATEPKTDFHAFYRGEKTRGKSDAEISKAWRDEKIRVSAAGRPPKGEGTPATSYLLSPDGKDFIAIDKKDIGAVNARLKEGYTPVEPGTIQMKNLDKVAASAPAPAPSGGGVGVGDWVKGKLGLNAPAPAPSTPKAPTAQGTPPLNALREGKITTFANGQRWTLQGGNAVQVR